MRTEPHEFQLEKLVAREDVLIDGHVFLIVTLDAAIKRRPPHPCDPPGTKPVRELDEVRLTLVHAYWKCRLCEPT